MRSTAIQTLGKLAVTDSNIFLLTADLGFKIFDQFRSTHPDRFINVGVAEANMVGIATGLALSGHNVYCYSIVPFLTMRCLEQIRVDLCYHNLNVKLVGIGGGLAYGLEGMTHHAVEDISIMRSLPNMTVVVPGDPLEVEAIVNESATHQGPLYIRLGTDGSPQVHQTIPELKIGKGIVLNEGGDVGIIANGTMLHTAKIVSETLVSRGLAVTLISMPTVKPLDGGLVAECARGCEAIFTIEEHSIIGGLGSAVAEVLAESGYRGLFRRIAMPDAYGSDIGKVEYLREKCGLTPEVIMNHILSEYERQQCRGGRLP